MKTIKSKIFPFGILSLMPRHGCYWAVKRCQKCIACDLMPVKRLRFQDLERAKREFDLLDRRDYLLGTLNAKDGWLWSTGEKS